MAILALHSGVRSQQREAILVVLYLLRGDRPALHRVALLAIRTHLSAVHIAGLVAIRASLAHIRKHRLHVARYTLHFFVHAAERIVRFVVIEFRNRADGFPTSRGVTVFTGNRQWTMRVTSGFFLRMRRNRIASGSARGKCAGEQQSRPQNELEEDSRNLLHSAAGRRF